MTPEIHHAEAFVEDALALVLAEAEKAYRARGEFRLSLCGGGTPRPVYEALAVASGPIDWAKTVITFGDERCVPPDHARSNYRMAREALLDHVSIPDPENQVLRMRGELPPTEAAAHYEETLRSHANRSGEAIFTHDLLLLGMGEDGHTASLFPGTTALDENDRWVVANHVPKFDEDRITLTYPLINAARHVCFLVTGENKRPVYEKIFASTSDDPAARISPGDGRLTWLIG